MANKEKTRISKINIIISIAIAFVAWVFVVYNYSPMKNVKFIDVPITFVGEEQLVQKGLGIETATTDSVDVTLSINRKHYNDISADDIIVEADVTNAVEGSNGVSLNVTSPSDSALVRISTAMIEVQVVTGANKDVPLTTIYNGNAEDGTEPVCTNMSYKYVSVLGAADNVAKVRAAVIRLNRDAVGENNKSFVASPVAVDESGKIVKHVVVLPGEISFNARIGDLKEVKLSLTIKDSSQLENYRIEAPETIYIKGPGSLLGKIKAVSTDVIDITGITEDTIIPLTFKLPDGVYVAGDSLGAYAKVVFK